MSSSDDMFPIAKDRAYIDLPMSSDELVALASVLTFTKNALDICIKDASEQNNTVLAAQYDALQKYSKLLYNKVSIVSTIGDADNKTVH